MEYWEFIQKGVDQMLDMYLWNEQTDLVFYVFDGLEEIHPEIDRWYEVKQGKEKMLAAGAVVIELGVHSWLGCPRNRDIGEYLKSIT